MRRWGLVVALSLISLLLVVVIAPNHWYYRNRRATRAGKILNRGWSWVAAMGLTPTAWPGHPRCGTISLETRGRVSGLPRSNAVTWVEQEGERYLVALLGEKSDWVRNVRAAAGHAVIRHGGRQRVMLEEVPAVERAPILRAYLKRTAMSTKVHLGLDTNAPLQDFERIAPLHPVFRIVPSSSAG